jgi:hypothetical protein
MNHLAVRRVTGLVLVASLAPAQSWSPVEATPRGLAGVAFDEAGRRAIAASASGVDAWHHYGDRWSRVTMPGLDPTAGIAAIVGLDASAGMVLVDDRSPQNGGSRTYVGSGTDWALVTTANGTGPLPGAAIVRAPNGRVLAFGGVDANGQDTDQTLLWNGVQWTLQQLAVRPAPRRRAGIAFDRQRNRVVMVGGLQGQTERNDTWEWNGFQWLSFASGPMTGRAGTLVFDPAIARCLLLGGVRANGAARTDVWWWNGGTWSQTGTVPAEVAGDLVAYDDGVEGIAVQRSHGTRWQMRFGQFVRIEVPPDPPAVGATIAYHATRGEVVFVDNTIGGETWVWNATWQRRGVNLPGRRPGTAMAPIGNHVLLFGGQTGLATTDESWLWDGVAWTLTSPAVRPPGRRDHALASRGNQVVLFGGSAAGGVRLGDTWTFDGATWTQRAPTTSPSARTGHGMAHDAARNRTVLFGGNDGQPRSDTWEWNGSLWLPMTPTTVPNVTTPRLAHDPVRSAVVMVAPERVWTWDGADWAADPVTSSATQPPQAVAWHEARQRLLQIDARGAALVLGPTPPTGESFGAACSTAPELRLLNLPRIGAVCELQLHGSPGWLGVFSFGLQPANIPWPGGCTQRIQGDASVIAVLDAAGYARLPFAIPDALPFRGVQILAQGVEISVGPVVNGGFSAGLRIAVGD